ncbi:ATP-dependent Clp protease proteolytic subunit [Cetobacterium sp.]|uniref:ATP-dependent Clp protease proteolytic subunit n=1 Tax=Cetobacterium sp. TaxID=2071632 RepID=UPI003F2C7848
MARKKKELEEQIIPVDETCGNPVLTDEQIEEISAELMDLVPFTMSLYLHDYVDKESVLPIIKGIRKANNPFEMTYEEVIIPDMGGQFIYKQFDKIILNINSSGGSVDAGMALINEIQKSEIPVECVITNAHSMAFLIAVCCHKRQMYKYGKMMWHDSTIGLYDKVKNLNEFLDVIQKEDKMINEILVTHTKLTLKELKEIIDKKQDKYFFSEEALSKGLVDEII